MESSSSSSRCAALRAWWEETTDTRLLSSPWICRPAGTSLRVATMLCNIIVWAIRVRKHHFASSLTVVLSVLMCYFWAASLWFAIMTRWESLSGSLWFAWGMILSAAILSMGPDQVNLFDQLDCFVYVFAVLSHCNVHPVVLLFTVLCGFFADAVVLYIDDECIDPLSRLRWTYTQSSLIIALFAFTFDFNSRVKMLSSEKHLTQISERPRVPRICCWLAGVNNWIFYAAILLIKAQHKDDGLHWWDNHLPQCTMGAPVVAMLCMLTAVASFSRGYGNLADTSMTGFVSLPGFLLLADWTVAIHTRAHSLDNPFFYQFTWSLASITFCQGTFALQVLILAGCHPACCSLAGILMTILGLSAVPPLIDSPRDISFDPWCVCCILYVILPTSHALDRFRRKQAITNDEMELADFLS